MADSLSVMSGALDPFGEFGDLLFVLLLGIRVGLFFSRKRGEIESAGLNFRPIQNHRDTALELHFVHGPASEIKRRGLATEDTAIAGKIKTAASGDGENFSDARSASNRDVFA